MAHIVLFHSILGPRAAEQEIADNLGEEGHVVDLPDLYDGQRANSYEEGFEIKDRIGDAVLQERARKALEKAPAAAVLAGVSYGAFLIGSLWGDRPQMPAAVLIAGVAPWAPSTRSGLKVSAHIARPDPFDDEAFFAEWAADARGVQLELHRYDGVGHYFLDRSLDDYSEAAAITCLRRIKAFLRTLPPA